MKKKISMVLALALALGALSGCGGKNGGANVDAGEAKYASTYPLEAETTLTHWMPLTSNISTSAANFGELPVAKELEKRTGIKVEYIHPSLTNAQEKFNLMIASGDLADLITYYWENYSGGPDKALADKVILPLNSYIEAYAPNMQKVHKEYPDIARASKSNDGQYFAGGLLQTERKLRTSGGLIIRKDWLDDLNLEMPETIDEWYVVLKAFKEQKGATAALSIVVDAAEVGAFTGAYGVTTKFYHDKDDKVHYGPMENGYKEFLTTMNKWYNEGLFNNNFSTTDGDTITANMLSGKAGVIYGGLGGGIGTLMNAATDPNFEVTGAPYPTHKKGEKPMFGQLTADFMPTTTISSKCKDVELAMKLIDYGYSEEGKMFYNFGTEGQTYTMEDGYPKYTELITKNPDGLSMSQALTKYSMGGQRGAFSQDVRYLEQYAGKPEQQEAWNRWIDTDAESYVMPNVYIASEDLSEYSSKMTDIKTYVDEMYIKFISGVEPIENFESYVSELKRLGVEDVIRMQQEAYNKYLEQ